MSPRPLPGQLDLGFPDTPADHQPASPPAFLWPGSRCRVRPDVPGLAGQVVTVTARLPIGCVVWCRTADGFDCPFVACELEVIDEP